MRPRVLGLVGPLLLCVAVLGIGAGSAHAADTDALHTVGQYAAALKKDPILVQSTMGAGHTDAVRSTLIKLAKALPYPVHVAIVQTPTDLQSDDVGRDLATALRRRVGAPGLYLVCPAGGSMTLQTTGAGINETTLSLANYAAESAVYKRIPGNDDHVGTCALDAQIALEVAAAPGIGTYGDDNDIKKVLLSDKQVDALAAEPWARAQSLPEDDFGESHVGKRWMVGTTAGVAVLLVVAQSLMGWPGWRRRDAASALRAGATPTRPSQQALHSAAEERVAALAEALAAMRTPAPHPDVAADALAAREAAESKLDGDYLDLVGAMALAYTGLDDVERAGDRSVREPYRSCYFNPLHGRATGDTEWRYGDAEIEVPTCSQCRSDVLTGSTPDILRVHDSPRSPAYFERDSVWARTGFGALVDHFGQAVLADRGEQS